MGSREILVAILEDNPIALQEAFDEALTEKLEFLIEREALAVSQNLFFEDDGGDGGADYDEENIDWDEIDDLDLLDDDSGEEYEDVSGDESEDEGDDSEENDDDIEPGSGGE